MKISLVTPKTVLLLLCAVPFSAAMMVTTGEEVAFRLVSVAVSLVLSLGLANITGGLQVSELGRLYRAVHLRAR